MMKKHATSHGLAALVCTVLGGVLIGVGHDHYPILVDSLERAGAELAAWLELDCSPRTVATVILTTVMAAIWGMGFSILHSD